MSRKFQKNKSAKKMQSKRGFSMLEMLIAGFILSVGLIATLQLVAKSMSESADARNHVIASSLAQEGLELVRNIRDNSTNPIAGSFEHIPDGNTSGDSVRDNCRVDKTSIEILPADCGSPTPSKNLYINGNFYVHSVSIATKFQRKIRLEYQNSSGTPMSKDNGTPTNIDDAYQVNIQSMVIWGSSFPAVASCNVQNKCVVLESTLTKRY